MIFFVKLLEFRMNSDGFLHFYQQWVSFVYSEVVIVDSSLINLLVNSISWLTVDG